MQRYFSIALIGYLLGSIPFAYIFTRIWTRGDIRTVGSGNVGTTNVVVQVGRVPGLLTAIGDGTKGLFAAIAGSSILPTAAAAPLVGLLFAVIGHNWSIWLGFEGGGGLATTIGGLVEISFAAALCALSLWGLTYILTGHKYVSSVGACAVLPLALGLLRGTWTDVWLGAALALSLSVKQVAAWYRWASGRLKPI